MKPLFAAHTPSDDRPGQWHDLKAHLGKVAAKAKAFATKFNAGELAYFAGLWHDLGKYNPKFQKYLEQCEIAAQTNTEEPREKVPHAIHGAKLALEKFSPIAQLIYGHHGGLPQASHMNNRIAEVDEALFQQILKNAASESIDFEINQIAFEQLEALAPEPYAFELLLRLLFSCLVDADYLDTESHFDPNLAAQRGSQITISDLWGMLKTAQEELLTNAEDTPINQVRAEVYQACVEAATSVPGVFRLAVPTGGGKTRSGLAFALAHAQEYKLERVIIAVPYTSIIEQTVTVYQNIFGKESVLEHHSAVRPEAGNEEDARARQAQARLATQNWDAPLIVTTTVQLFESLLANRTSRCRKLHNITKSVIILDEVQTLPAGLLTPILSVLKELCRQYQVSIVLCTATQPALEGDTPYLSGFPTDTVRDIIPKSRAEEHFKTLSRVKYTIQPKEWSWTEVAQSVREHQQALVICNTRKDALTVFDQLSGSEDDHLFHLSTLLCGQHRREILRQVKQHLKQKQPCLLISTQVVEAGVDLDFPVVYRALGPLDRIVQAAGRCNREGRMSEKGQVIIFSPQEGNLPPGEYRKAFEETLILLKREELDWNDPGIFKDYFQRLYQGLELDTNQVQPYRHNFDYPEVAKRFKLIPDDTTPVVIEYNNQVSQLVHRIRHYGLRSGDIKALQPYLVSLRSREFRETEELRELIAPGIWLWQGNYDRRKGISIGDMAIVRDPADLIF
jgi:CRISPR-associated endonuclease/helicase Cas3